MRIFNMKEKAEKKTASVVKIALVCSTGGHLFQLYSLKDYWKQFDRFWMTFNREDSKYLLKDEQVYWAYAPTSRNAINFIKNLFLSIKIIFQEKPDLIISTGSGVAVPLIYCAKIFGIKTIHIESLTRIKELSLTGKLLHNVVDEHFVQWEELAKKYKKAKFVGQVI